MKIKSKKILVILLFAGILRSLPVTDTSAKDFGNKFTLTGSYFSQWRSNTGQWEIVGDAFMKPDNEKLLGSKPGTGVIINGPTGRTSHLFS